MVKGVWVGVRRVEVDAGLMRWCPSVKAIESGGLCMFVCLFAQRQATAHVDRSGEEAFGDVGEEKRRWQMAGGGGGWGGQG